MANEDNTKFDLIQERRNSGRVKLNVLVNEFVNNEMYLAKAENISRHGIFIRRPVEITDAKPSILSLEFRLPGNNEKIWVKGEVVHNKINNCFYNAGIRFRALSVEHAKLIESYISSTVGHT